MEAKINNSEEQRKIRKSQSTLVIVGTGTMLFGAWSALKSYSLVLLRQGKTIEELRSYLPEGTPPISDKVLLIGVLVAVTLYVLAELGVRLFIGFSAIAEGLHKRSGKMYIVLTFILILMTLIAVLIETYGVICNAVGGFNEIFNDTEYTTQEDVLTSLVIDLTSLVMMIQMVISAFRVKKYKKRQRQQEAANAA